jgi:hypothetical protein
VHSCQIVKCRRSGTLKCSHCSLVWYCSQECESADRICHRAVCHSDLSRRLCGLRDVILKHKCGNVYLSSFMNDVAFYGNKHNISAFGPWRVERCCAICGSDVGRPPPIKNAVDFLYKQREIRYYRSDKCLEVDKLLCQTTLACTTLCRDANRRKVILLFELALQIDPDTACLIALLFHSLCTCW